MSPFPPGLTDTGKPLGAFHVPVGAADAGPWASVPTYLLPGLSQVVRSGVLFLCWWDIVGPSQGLSQSAEAVGRAGTCILGSVPHVLVIWQ